ncbi:MAG: adenylosuccinate lyase [Proteobacteria bacterium]|nr:adenylosuccinate lyase [Pseudomonadota bacterium]NDB14873.1 adenylosuccinate lyase [Betaproteobacteria bacterium]
MHPTPDQAFRLKALSPLDGRYATRLADLAAIFSEAGFMAHRVRVEIAWLKALSHFKLPQLPCFERDDLEALDAIAEHFGIEQAHRIKAIEADTNHDVKAVEYFLKESVLSLHDSHPRLAQSLEFIHFACTSEDINNTAQALMLLAARDGLMLEKLEALIGQLRAMAQAYAAIPMLSRTHGQAATPTTLGKEIANVHERLRRAKAQWQEVKPLAKMNGAVGNFNAHLAAYPDVDWEALAKWVLDGFGLEQNTHSIQIEPHDWMAAYFDALARINAILIDLDRDLWGYVSLGYFRQRSKPGEVGSSTMPHKVNPIDFENSEGNLGVANALLRHLSDKLPQSRWQRDLTDSTVLRNLGVALGYSLLAWDSCLRGLEKLEVDRERLEQDLAANWEVLAEPIQTVMRRWGVDQAYEQLKALSRGKRLSAEDLRQFIVGLSIPESEKARLLALSPSRYTGMAEQLARRIESGHQPS